MFDPNINNMKLHVPLALDWYSDRTLTPTCLFFEAGGIYGVDRTVCDGLKASRQAGGFGYRYTVRTSCECEEELNYNKYFFLYLELYGTIGRWDCDDTTIDMVSVTWDVDGRIMPRTLHLENGFTYQVDRVLQMYPMSRRKSDGAGMRYIVSASCEDLEDSGRTFPLMLEEGGEFVGSWFCEDYTTEDRSLELMQLKEYH